MGGPATKRFCNYCKEETLHMIDELEDDAHSPKKIVVELTCQRCNKKTTEAFDRKKKEGEI